LLYLPTPDEKTGLGGYPQERIQFQKREKSHRLKIIPRDILVLEEARERLEEMGIRAVI
jgi:hypothetical protein